MTTRIATILIVAAIGLTPAMLASQAPQPPAQGGPPGPGGQAGRGGRGGPPAYPPREVDAAMVARGGEFYKAQCAFCHGADTRGASGPSLLRSQLVQDDRNGETIGVVVRNGRGAMPRFDVTDALLADVAAFLHSFQLNSRDPARMRPPDILTGDAAAGQVYFNAKCASCHAVDRDLKGLAARFADPRALQQWWLMPGGGGGRGGGGGDGGGDAGGGGGGAPPAPRIGRQTATITLASGQKFTGRLLRIDEFTVSVEEADGTTRSFTRRGDEPRVEIQDPLARHKAMLREYTDKDIHDVTAFLVTLK